MSDGFKNGQSPRLNGPQEEIGAYVTKIGQKRRAALFIITGATSSTVRPRLPVAAKLNRFDNFLRYSASDVCIRDVEETHCVCISTCTNERIQLARNFLQSALLVGLGTILLFHCCL